ncbi:MAG: HD-GYP domain-containing protein [Streptosporangiaceae bacterium]
MTSHSHPAERWSAWQSLDSGRLLLLAAAGMLVVAAVARTSVGVVNPRVAIAFGGFIAFGELLRLALPGGREAAPIAMAGAMSYALLVRVAGELGIRQISALQVIAVAAVGMTVGALPHIAAGRPAGVTGMATRLLAVAAVAFAFRPLVEDQAAIMAHWPLTVAVMTALALVGWLVDAVIGALIRADDLRAKFTVSLWDEMRVQWPLGASVGASVLIIVFAAQIMGPAELVLFLPPLLVTQIAFRRYAGIRATYLQTVRALARVTEVGGYVEGGHSRRVSRLAVAVGRELGMSEPDLLDLEYAALMHDIGQLSLRDPIPGGATVLVSAADAERIAQLGADIIFQARVLDKVAHLVRCQCWPSRGREPQPPVGSRIIRAANAFDDLVGGSTNRDRINAALEHLRLDTAREYDPAVIEALSEVAGRRLASRL